MKANFSTELKKAGLKVTSSRIFILSIFSNLKLPIKAEELVRKSKGKNIDQATVYRTLASLLKAEILRQVDVRKDAVYYELNHHHHHLICTDCGAIENLKACNFKKLSKDLLSHSSKFTKIKDHSIEFFGVCNACQNAVK